MKVINHHVKRLVFPGSEKGEVGGEIYLKLSFFI